MKYKDAFGWHIKKQDPRYPDRWLYIYKIHRDGSIEWTTDYSLALRLSEKRASMLVNPTLNRKVKEENHD